MSVDEHLDDSDIQLCCLNSRLLGSKSNALLNTGFAMPQGIPAGAYYLIGWVDSGELVSESNEVNNLYVQIINVAGSSSTDTFNQSGDLMVFPNPSSDRVQVNFDGVPGQNSMIWVYDPLGRTVLYREVPASVENQLIEDISGWSPGIYLIRLQQGANIRSTRLIVQ
ncbi:MAG: T9SS type A sorting domain-containing protein [Candidatus Moranbacteria bacterium]|nr:T9SS type A sorting domain-containing protein [Candidatus Moranbacteria bacterium]